MRPTCFICGVELTGPLGAHTCGGSPGLANAIPKVDPGRVIINGAVAYRILDPVVAEQLAHEEEQLRRDASMAFGRVIGGAAMGDEWCIRLLRLAATCAANLGGAA